MSLRPRRQGPRDRDGRGCRHMTVSTAPTGTARIARAFARAREEKRLAIVVYLTVGYPDRAATAALLRAALDGGADVLELGVPFSDPLADGATVQRASEIALRNGIGLTDCLAEASTIVRERDATVLLMGYTNPFLRYRGGLAGFASDAARAGVAGVLRSHSAAGRGGRVSRALRSAPPPPDRPLPPPAPAQAARPPRTPGARVRLLRVARRRDGGASRAGRRRRRIREARPSSHVAAYSGRLRHQRV